jgi:hypothetical protein
VAVAALATAVVPATSAAQSASGLAEFLRPGQVEVEVTPDEIVWNPRVNLPVWVRFAARPRGHSRTGKEIRVWAKFQSPHRRCGRSFGADRGRSLGPMVGEVSKAGDILASTNRRHVSRKPGRVRFCVWIGSPRAKPATREVLFPTYLFGAAMFRGTPSPPDDPWLDGTATSTVPFGGTQDSTDPNCSTPAQDKDASIASPAGFYGAYVGGRTRALDCPDVRERFELPGTLPGQFPEVLIYHTADLTLPVSPIKSIGDCVPFDVARGSLAEAQANLRAVGCTPGRVIRIHDPKHSPGVLGASIHGLLALLAPRDTAVDLTLNQ